MWLSSPSSVTASILHALELPPETRGAANWRSVNLPGISVSIDEMVQALGRAGGDTKLVSFQRDPAIERIVQTIPGNFTTPIAHRLGFPPAETLDGLVAEHIRH
jgi:nucleoside-diphosphate-sugar epimerase